MDLKDIIAKDRKDGAIEFAQWLLKNCIMEDENVIKYLYLGPHLNFAMTPEELYELFLKSKE